MKKKLQVFVSSTYEDLKHDRQAAVSAILKAGHIPAGMELFTSGDQSQMDTIRRWIDESDVYMLILGGRYGSVEPTTQVSYTELEYDYASQQGKPLFAVVISEDALEVRVREFGTSLMEKENPKQLKDFRDKALSNISSFFSDEKDIRLCVYESLSDFAANRDLKGWVSSDEVLNSQALLDEIATLREENEQLRTDLSKAQKSAPKQKTPDANVFDEIIAVLKATEVKVPAEHTADKVDAKINLLSLFQQSSESLITGVTNSVNSSSLDSFLYYNVCPKLQIHELVINEKVASVRWRRFAITPLGTKLLAHLAKQKLLAENET
ncbi:TPA: DUF4062 domain-containing protein [Vibrio alginolyticus]|uniref:DUF4062 domain-containing protein n=1 Tax=Vibrio sp. 2CM40D TaxID=2929855 RepID=UPI0020BE5453|nr:DUF4062 domain-containing protein [Vibrio sp. 2CM40D]EHA1206492.1 DUF4062 domain-containing protein [Vibrio alginolyticus]MCK8113782.1 DUF4062 domain-containing protein [Vibrio sp. 2CM40D]